jgi:thiol-disulfide isomerase/thioredoxin
MSGGEVIVSREGFWMDPIKIFAWVALLAAFCATVGQTQEQRVALIPVNYAALKRVVSQQRGKVVLVDFWAGFCRPCQKKLPYFIDMHKNFADQGFVLITVSVDEPNDPEKVEAANAFLRKINSPVLNLLLNEPIKNLSKTLDFERIPCYYLFDRQGKWVRYGGDPNKDLDYEDLERTVVRLLNEK